MTLKPHKPWLLRTISRGLIKMVCNAKRTGPSTEKKSQVVKANENDGVTKERNT